VAPAVDTPIPTSGTEPSQGARCGRTSRYSRRWLLDPG